VRKTIAYKYLFVSLIFVLLVIFSFVGCKPAKMQAPINIRLNEEEFFEWDAVDGATKYIIKINEEEYFTESNSFDAFSTLIETKTYNVSVMACGDGEVYFDSDWSEVKPIEYEVADISAIQHAPTDKGECTIRAGAGKTIVGKLVLPGHVNDYKVTSIYYEGFKGQREITGVYIPDTVEMIEEGAFDDCTKINRVRLPENNSCEVKSAFRNSKSLKRLHIPDRAHINWYKNMTALEYVTIGPENHYKLDGNCLIGNNGQLLVRGFKGATIPDYVTKIASNAFLEVEIEEIVIPENVTEIGDGAFVASSLKRVVLPDSITEIGDWFHYCTDLVEVVLGSNTRTINASFYGCTSLPKIEFPDTLREVKGGAFGNCASLESIDFNKLEKISTGSFAGTGLKKLHIPATLTDISVSITGEGQAFTSSFFLQEITVAEDNPVYFSDSNCILERGTNKLIAGCKDSVIPSYVKELGNSCFAGAPIERLVIPVGVEKIGAAAFYCCTRLRELYIPNTVTEIGDSAFEGVIPYYAISIPNSVTNADGNAIVFDYDPYAFYSDAIRNEGGTKRWLSGLNVPTMGYDGNYPYVVSVTLYENKDKGEFVAAYGGEFYLHAPCRQGYTFAGWATEPGGPVVITANSAVKHSTFPSTSPYVNPTFVTRQLMVSLKKTSEQVKYPGGTVLYAVWIPN